MRVLKREAGFCFYWHNTQRLVYFCSSCLLILPLVPHKSMKLHHMICILEVNKKHLFSPLKLYRELGKDTMKLKIYQAMLW